MKEAIPHFQPEGSGANGEVKQPGQAIGDLGLQHKYAFYQVSGL